MPITLPPLSRRSFLQHGTAAALLADRPVRLSLSHAGDYAMAVVLIEDE